MLPKFRPNTEWLYATALCVCLSLTISFVSENLKDRFDLREEFIAAQFATLDGRPIIHYGVPTYYPPFQNRILFPAAFALLSNVRIFTTEQWYLIVRMAFAAILFGVAWFVFRRITRATPKQAAAGCVMLAYALIGTFNFKWEHTSDYADGAFTLLMIAATITRKPAALAATALVAATNRESAAFAGVFWICMYGVDAARNLKWKDIAYGAAVSMASYAAVLVLRYAFGGSKAVDGGTQVISFLDGLWGSIQYALDEPGLFAWPVLAFAMVGPLLLWIGTNIRALGLAPKRLLLASLVITLITIGFGYVNELRIFIPTLVTLTVVATWGEALASRLPRLGASPKPP